MPKEELSVPFITRKMLAFEGATTFSLVVQSTSDDTKQVTLRGFTKEGPFTFQITNTGDGTLNTQTLRISDVPIFVTVIDEANGYSEGEFFCRVSLAVNGDIVHQLAAGYIFGINGISWPTSNLAPSVPYTGILSTRSGSNPAAGSETSITVPANQIWRVYSWRAQLVTDGTAVNRFVHLRITDGSNRLYETFTTTAHTASLTRDHFAFHGVPTVAAFENTESLMPFPAEVWLREGSVISTVTTNLQAGDNWGVPQVRVQIYPTVFV